MSSILDQLLEDIKSSQKDVQIKQVCDQIFEEEKHKFAHPELKPEGSNIFLAIEVPDKKNVKYFCLEREWREKYIASLWSRKGKIGLLNRQKVWEINEVEPKKIFKFFAETLKHVKGDF